MGAEKFNAGSNPAMHPIQRVEIFLEKLG